VSAEFALITRWLRKSGRFVFDGRLVRTDKGRLAEHLQRSAGDLLVNTDDETIASIEVKTEVRKTSRLFLETVSNAVSGRAGWLWTLDADWLFYYFEDTDDLYVVDFQRLRAWARSPSLDGNARRIDDYHERRQTTHWQPNTTYGRTVPIAVLEAELEMKLFHPRRDLDGGGTAAGR
jgi:hypothetical protein